MPKVMIDGREIEVPAGTTILKAAESLGLEVPQMCYHPGLRVVGVCRVCLCQVKGQPKMTTACSTEVRDGMQVDLYTPEAEKARKAVIEFWLLNHPLDCPVCDQGGECPLQDIAFDHGPGESRLNDAKVHKEKRVELGPHVILDEERCILCWRCTRFTQEVSGSNQIMLRDRGAYTAVGTPPGLVLDDPYSGNVVDLCPVGALTTRDFRFRSRVWEMSATEGVCTACPVGCNTYTWSKKERLERLTARPNLRVNDYWLCDRGRFDTEFVNDPGRLTTPLVRVDGMLRAAGWDDAVHALVEGLRPFAAKGHNQVGALATRHLANEEYWMLQKLVRATLGSNHVVAGRRETLTAARVDLARRGRLLTGVTSLDTAEAILVVGGDIETTHPVLGLRLRKAVREHGAALYLATPHAGRLDEAARAVERVPAAGVAEWLTALGRALKAGAADGMAGKLHGVSRLAVLLDAGDHNAELAEVWEAFLAAQPSGGAWKALFLDLGGNIPGAMALGMSPQYFPGFRAVGADEAQQLKSRWGGRVHGEPGLGWDDLLTAASEGKVPALLLVNSGRPAAWGWTEREKALLRKAPFVAAFDCFDHEVREFAHVILPAPVFPELDATFMTVDGLVQLSRRNMVPRVSPLTQVVHRVIGALGGKSKAAQPIEIFRELARDVPAFGGLNYGSLGRTGARGEARPLAGVGA